ncbi:alkaline-phosphatase-like protein [Coniochaeta sp. 2T2.1]|nr:alkaline-phosphatase-like protein [Coniochaeta sp. 2T2.1]
MKSRQNAALASTLWLVAANVLIAVSVLLFATGFFPYKPVLPGLAQYGKGYTPQEAPFDRLVFMVVDALRSDFVFSEGSGFKYTQSLIRDGSALPFTAHATSPTVTMPRLKAITTGSIPSFLDAILNLDETDKTSSLASQDSWLAQMKAKDTGQVIMYGDDTWLKLFPGTFDRADGTTSFFVSDFTEVDNNVTRHVAGELKNDDWNTMVLHYLGLDHIGHKGGPRSFHMLPKQQEMDGIVKQIHSAIETEQHLQSTLFVLCGDHGMNDAGNHGGSSAGETSPALVFISPKLQTLQRRYTSPLPPVDDFQFYSTVEQSDIAPTLAALLGFPVPQNNLGVMISDFLPLWEQVFDKVQILLQNMVQIKAIMSATFGSHIWEVVLETDDCAGPNTDAEELACDYKKMMTEAGTHAARNEHESSLLLFSNWLRKAQDVMSSMASNYDMSRLISGQALAVLAMVCASSATHGVSGQNLRTFLPFGFFAVMYGIMMFASSYVEEEQHFWYWATTAWLALIGVKNFNGRTSSRWSHFLAVLLVLAATRIIRGWNQTGQKFAGEPDIVKTSITPKPNLLWILVSATYAWIARDLTNGFGGLSSAVGFIISTGLTLAAFTFKLAYTTEDAPELVSGLALKILNSLPSATLVARAQAIFIGLAAATVGVLYTILTRKGAPVKTTGLSTLHTLYTLLAVTQSRTTNIPLFLLFNIQLKFLGSQALDGAELATSTLLLSSASFFAFGGSNAMSSVDLSNAYNGVSNFNATAVGVLTFISNWAAPIWWTFAAATLLVRKRKAGEENVCLRHVAFLTVFATFSAAAVMAACTALRTHLFIWTVFSPKYLYCVAWTLGQHLLVNIGVGGILYWLGGRA